MIIVNDQIWVTLAKYDIGDFDLGDNCIYDLVLAVQGANTDLTVWVLVEDLRIRVAVDPFNILQTLYFTPTEKLETIQIDWKLKSQDLVIINEQYFIMPLHMKDRICDQVVRLVKCGKLSKVYIMERYRETTQICTALSNDVDIFLETLTTVNPEFEIAFISWCKQHWLHLSDVDDLNVWGRLDNKDSLLSQIVKY